MRIVALVFSRCGYIFILCEATATITTIDDWTVSEQLGAIGGRYVDTLFGLRNTQSLRGVLRDQEHEP